MTDHARRGRGRRPTAQVRADILEAAGRLFMRSGLQDFNVERIATEAGVSKTSVYKMWPSTGALAADAYFHSAEPVLTFPDTGDICADLSTQLHEFVQLLTGTAAGPALRNLIGHAQSDPHLLQHYQERYSLRRRALAVARLNRAKAAGQLRADLDCEVVVDQLWGACYHRLLLPDQPLTIAFVDALVRNLLYGIT